MNHLAQTKYGFFFLAEENVCYLAEEKYGSYIAQIRHVSFCPSMDMGHLVK